MPNETETTDKDIPFGVNEMRLNWRQWLAALAIFLIIAVSLPHAWKRVERFDTGPDYRIPYDLSSDYWLYQRRLDEIPAHTEGAAVIPVIGDSVVWGEYVLPNGTLTHFLSQRAGPNVRFANCGVNGAFPLALEGLVDHYGGSLRHRKVILQYNVLWMSSPKADLSSSEEQAFNHSQLVAQLFQPIPAYHADATARLNAIAGNKVGMFQWVNHVDSVYFDHLSIPAWTLEEDPADPQRWPNVRRNPLSQLKMQVPGEPANDPKRGPSSPRHRPWSANSAHPTHFEWVSLDRSLQWKAFQRTVALLRARGSDVFVIVGPFDEWMVAEDQRPTYRSIRDGVSEWLTTNRVAHLVPEALSSDLYADASHPLTEGYSMLAERIAADTEFKKWLAAP